MDHLSPDFDNRNIRVFLKLIDKSFTHFVDPSHSGIFWNIRNLEASHHGSENSLVDLLESLEKWAWWFSVPLLHLLAELPGFLTEFFKRVDAEIILGSFDHSPKTWFLHDFFVILVFVKNEFFVSENFIYVSQNINSILNYILDGLVVNVYSGISCS